MLHTLAEQKQKKKEKLTAVNSQIIIRLKQNDFETTRWSVESKNETRRKCCQLF